MKQKTTQAVVLKRINYGEADRILTVLTHDSGLLTLFAKGARRAKSKLSGGLELFSITDITYIDGRTDMKTITSTRLSEHFAAIVRNVDKTMAAYDFMSLIHKFSEHTEQSDYYRLLIGGLSGLNNDLITKQVAESWFYANILGIFGSSVNVEAPLGDKSFQEDKKYNFSYDDMSFFEHPSGEYLPKHIKFMRLMTRSREPVQLQAIVGAEQLAQDVVGVLKTAASMHKA